MEFPGSIYGMVLNLEEDNVGVVIFGADYMIKRRRHRKEDRTDSRDTGRRRAFGKGRQRPRPADRREGPIDSKEMRRVELKAPGIVARKPVKESLQTGIKAIDAMIPIGRGQRELIIGDRQTGKTAVAIDTIINQKGQGVACIYVAIGQKQSTVALIVEKLREMRRPRLHRRRRGHGVNSRASSVYSALHGLHHRRVLQG